MFRSSKELQTISLYTTGFEISKQCHVWIVAEKQEKLQIISFFFQAGHNHVGDQHAPECSSPGNERISGSNAMQCSLYCPFSMVYFRFFVGKPDLENCRICIFSTEVAVGGPLRSNWSQATSLFATIISMFKNISLWLTPFGGKFAPRDDDNREITSPSDRKQTGTRTPKYFC